MDLPVPETPLYNHTLPQIEQWLKNQGCKQDEKELEHWQLKKTTWEAELWLDIEQIIVKYIQVGENGQDIQRSFKYSLCRRDIEEAVFSGP